MGRRDDEADFHIVVVIVVLILVVVVVVVIAAAVIVPSHLVDCSFPSSAPVPSTGHAHVILFPQSHIVRDCNVVVVIGGGGGGMLVPPSSIRHITAPLPGASADSSLPRRNG